MLPPTLPAAILLACLVQSQGATTTPAPTDASPLEATLKEARLAYTDIGRFYRLKYEQRDKKRSQQVYLRKEVYAYSSLRVQELYSLCYDSKEAPTPELLQSAFLKRFSIGGLVLEAPSESQTNWRIRFRVDAPVSLSTEHLKTYLQLVQGTADSLEIELNPGTEDRL